MCVILRGGVTGREGCSAGSVAGPLSVDTLSTDLGDGTLHGVTCVVFIRRIARARLFASFNTGKTNTAIKNDS